MRDRAWPAAPQPGAAGAPQWKGGYGDGRLGRWTQAALAEYLLDYFPRKVSVDEETLDAVPDCVCAFLGFLDARGSLSGEPLDQLVEACEALRDEFRECAGDSADWGPAKSLVMQMLAEGADPSAPGALDTWMTHLNARLREQRDVIFGRGADPMGHGADLPPAPGSQISQQGRAQRRKAQRTARKRNRRR